MHDHLAQLLEPIRGCVTSAVADMLSVPTRHHEDWTVVERIRNTSDLGATVGFASPDWQGACTIGVSVEAAAILFPGGNEEFVFDAIGEICNTICGVMAANPEFIEVFGALEQTPPMFSRGGAWLPRTLGIAGSIVLSDVDLWFGFSIRHTT